MRVFDAEALSRTLSYPALVDVLEAMFKTGCESPERHHHTLTRDGATLGLHLLMPAWKLAKAGSGERSYLGLKAVNVFPGNGARGLGSVLGAYLLFDGETGQPLAVLDGTTLTYWRTAGASAVASRLLARPDASVMTMVGAGNLAPYIVRAHASVRPIGKVMIWNRTRARAEDAAQRIGEHFKGRIEVATDLDAAVSVSDIVSAATNSREPLIRGRTLKRGAHVDLIGAFTPEMRETDEEAVKRARVFVDVMASAMKEAGDILQPLAAGAIGKDHVKGDLADLLHGRVQGRQSPDEITLFKSCGAALEDLAAAIHVYSSAAPS
ncbi:MAG: ornithine cyclodeaminase family protein [Hyphomicrobiaceae bacterium]|nr:MAG: ornithine cyclodeaminase family protein [Hyphomicrobiaceae bacterium]